MSECKQHILYTHPCASCFDTMIEQNKKLIETNQVLRSSLSFLLESAINPKDDGSDFDNACRYARDLLETMP